MKVIERPSYTRRNAEFHRISIGLSLVGILIGGFLLSLKMALVFGAFLFVGGVVILREVFKDGGRSWIAGYDGERRVRDSLQALSNEYVAVTNFVVPGTRQGDVDLLLIGPMGILVVEIKTYSGTILYKNRRWWRLQQNGRETPLKHVSTQARCNERVIRRYVAMQAAQDFQLRQATETVTAVLVFDQTEKIITDSLEMPALHTHQLADYVRGLPGRLTIDQIMALAHLFQIPSTRANVPNIVSSPVEPVYLQTKPTPPILTPSGSVVCCLCGKLVSEKVEQYCREHPERFGGKVYCYAHQQRLRKSA